MICKFCPYTLNVNAEYGMQPIEYVSLYVIRTLVRASVNLVNINTKVAAEFKVEVV